ncbi:MAG: RHS repeat-associated core domain-containing protein [Planctomycetota bacterium]
MGRRRARAVVGLYYFRNRYYDPEVGRFLQRDPLWDASNVGGQYTFVGCGPADLQDPTGGQAARRGPGLRYWLRNRDRIRRIREQVRARQALDFSTPADVQRREIPRQIEAETRAFFQRYGEPSTPGVTPRNTRLPEAIERFIRANSRLPTTAEAEELLRPSAISCPAQSERQFRQKPGEGPHLMGPEKAPRSAPPNSIYTQIARSKPDKAVQNTVYNRDGKPIGQVDFKEHHGARSGHGHAFPPGQHGVGHGPRAPHIPPPDVPVRWKVIPAGVSAQGGTPRVTPASGTGQGGIAPVPRVMPSPSRP